MHCYRYPRGHSLSSSVPVVPVPMSLPPSLPASGTGAEDPPPLPLKIAALPLRVVRSFQPPPHLKAGKHPEVGELCLSPVGLSYFHQAVAEAIRRPADGNVFLSISLGNLAAGLIAGEFDAGNVAAMPGQYMRIVYFAVGLGAIPSDPQPAGQEADGRRALKGCTSIPGTPSSCCCPWGRSIWSGDRASCSRKSPSPTCRSRFLRDALPDGRHAAGAVRALLGRGVRFRAA